MEDLVVRDIATLLLNITIGIVFALAAFYTIIIVFSATLSIFVKRLRAILSANKRIIVIIFVVLYGLGFMLVLFRDISMGAYMKDEIDVDSVDQMCTRDSDCIQISINCDCGKEEINKIHREKYIEMRNKLYRDVCQHRGYGACPAFEAEYVCNNGVCDVIYEDYL